MITPQTGDSIAIRSLEPGDAPACDAIVASLPYHFGDEHGRDLCAAAVREQAGLVAVRGDAPVGFVTWRPWYAAAIEITWMAVHARERRRGIGQMLVDAFLPASAPKFASRPLPRCRRLRRSRASTTATPALVRSGAGAGSSRSSTRPAGGTPRTRPS